MFWYAGGRSYYTGPIIEARVGVGSESERPSISFDRKDDDKEVTVV